MLHNYGNFSSSFHHKFPFVHCNRRRLSQVNDFAKRKANFDEQSDEWKGRENNVEAKAKATCFHSFHFNNFYDL